jgi:uncharacterized protein
MNRVRCPICQREMGNAAPQEWPEHPFCSPRCKTIDLGRWLGGQYVIPGSAEEEEVPSDPDEENSPP